MRNPPIIRAVVSDHFGYVLCDSAEPRYWRPGPARAGYRAVMARWGHG